MHHQRWRNSNSNEQRILVKWLAITRRSMKRYSKLRIAFPRTPEVVVTVMVKLDGYMEVEGIYKQNAFLLPGNKIINILLHKFVWAVVWHRVQFEEKNPSRESFSKTIKIDLFIHSFPISYLGKEMKIQHYSWKRAH